jgi:thioredoxin 1
MKRKIALSVFIFSLFLINCRSENNSGSRSVSAGGSTAVHLNEATFKEKIFNYDRNKEWKYEGNLPAIVDFYADWCPPCRQLSPVLEEIAREYDGKLIVYKVDTDKEKNLAQNLGITGLPTLLLIPAKGKPQVSMGFVPKENLIKVINEVLLTR